MKDLPAPPCTGDLVSLMLALQSNAGKVVLYGASSSGRRALLKLTSWGIPPEKFLFADSNVQKHGTKILDVFCIAPEEIMRLEPEPLVLITSTMRSEIEPMLRRMNVGRLLYSHELLFDRTLSDRFTDGFVELLTRVSADLNVSIDEAWTLDRSLAAVSATPGCVAEVGVYRGGTASILAQDSGRCVHLFDTFAGLPREKVIDSDLVLAGWLDDVEGSPLLDDLALKENVKFHRGIFPHSTRELKCETFALVHLDTDIYQSTLDGLRYFYPRLSAGGRILVHDFNNEGCPGVKRAVLEFGETNLIETSETQVLLLKPWL